MTFRISTTAFLLLAATANAHFKLIEPESIGFSDEGESAGPCGSFTPDFSKDTITDFHVGGQPIALMNTHPEVSWLFRATFDEAANGEWQQLYSIIDQQGLGDFCVPTVTAPDSWIGRTGVLSVVCDATDGLLYQCASVKFVEGVGDTGGNCKNGSDVKASVAADPTLASLATATISPTGEATGGAASASVTTGSETGGTATEASASATSSDNAGSHLMSGQAVPNSMMGAMIAIFCAAYGW